MFIMLVVAAVLCTIAALAIARPNPTPWYGYVHLGWLGLAFYLWSLVLAHGR